MKRIDALQQALNQDLSRDESDSEDDATDGTDRPIGDLEPTKNM